MNTSLLWVVVSLFCLESMSFAAFAMGLLDAPTYLYDHLGLCALTAVLGVWWARTSSRTCDAGDGIATIAQLVAWTAIAGPFGALTAGALLVPVDRATTVGNTLAGRPTPLTRLELLHRALLDRRLRLERAHEIRPMLDIIIEGSQVEKLDALSLISKRYVPALAPALKRALEDKDSSVRVLASTVMANLHTAHTKRIGVLQATADASPHEPRHWKDLAQAHRDYAGSGLLEGSRLTSETAQARAFLVHAAELGSGEAARDGYSADKHEVAFHGG